MEEYVGRLKDALRRLQMGIYYLNTYLRESFEMKSTLESLEKAHGDLKEILSAIPDLEMYAEEYVREQDLLPVFKEMKARYDAIVSLMRKYEFLIDEIDTHLERYRTYRYYMFKEDDAIARFADTVFSGRGDISVRPLIVSTQKIGEALSKLGGEQIGKHTFRFSGDKAGDVADLFLREFPSAGFIIEGNEVRMTWKPEIGVVRIDAPKDRIHEYDEVARHLDATVLAI